MPENNDVIENSTKAEHKNTHSVRENKENAYNNKIKAHENNENAYKNKVSARENRTNAHNNKIESRKEKRISTVKEMRVINDPYRRDIMFTLLNLQKPTTSKEVADILGEAPSKINYHMGILYEHGFVVLDHTENINGIIAKYYKVELSTITADMESNESEFRDEKVFKEFIRTQFDMARDKFLSEALNKTLEDIQKENDIGPVISTKKIYLNQQQKQEYETLLSKIIEYKGEKKDDSKPYSIFISYIEEGDKSKADK